MPCPTCGHTLHKLGVLEGRAHYHCPRCGTHRMTSGDWVHDTVPKLVGFLRGFERMISPGEAGRFLRNAAETAGIWEAIHTPGDRPTSEG